MSKSLIYLLCGLCVSFPLRLCVKSGVMETCNHFLSAFLEKAPKNRGSKAKAVQTHGYFWALAFTILKLFGSFFPKKSHTQTHTLYTHTIFRVLTALTLYAAWRW
jgi:hypothetical protein